MNHKKLISDFKNSPLKTIDDFIKEKTGTDTSFKDRVLLKKFRSSQEYKDMKYFFSPNMETKKYLLWNGVMIFFIVVLVKVWG
jgi:hypothetical protein